MTAKNKKLIAILLAIVVVMVAAPFLALRGAEFGGSDDAGSVMVEEIKGEAYEPWFTPVLENMIHGEIPGEIESLIFCLQTGIGVGVIAFLEEEYRANPRHLIAAGIYFAALSIFRIVVR